MHGEVDQLRWPAAQRRVLAVVAHRRDDVITQFGLFDQPRNFFGRVLQVGIEGDDDIALALFETGHDRRVLAVVAVKDDGHHRAAFAGRGVFQDLCGVVAAAVVDQYDFVGMVQLLAGCFGATKQLRQAVLFVVDRNDDRHEVDWVRSQRLLSMQFSMAPTTRWTSSVVMSGNNGIEHSRAEFHSVLGRYRLG